MKIAAKITTPRGLNFHPPRLVFAVTPIIPADDCGPDTFNRSTDMLSV